MTYVQIYRSTLAFGVPALLNLLSVVVFSRMLSLEQYGNLSLVWISIELIAGVSFGWCKMGMMRFFTKTHESLFVGSQFMLLVFLLLLPLLVVCFAFDLGILYLPQIILGAILRGCCYFIQDFYRISGQGLKKYTYFTFVSNTLYFLPSILYAIFSDRKDLNVIIALQVGGLGLLVGGLLATAMVKSKGRYFRQYKRLSYANFLKYALPLVVASVAVTLFIRVDRFVIEYYLGPRELGLYAAAFNLSNVVISSVFSIVTIATYPKIIRNLNEHQVEKAHHLFAGNSMVFLVFIPLLMILVLLFRSFLCVLFFGDKGPQIAEVFPWIVVCVYLFNLKQHHFDQILQFVNRTDWTMKIAAVTGLMHVLTSSMLIHRFKLNGVAFSSALWSLVGIICLLLLTCKRFPLGLDRKLQMIVCMLFVVVCGLLYISSI